MGLLRIFIQNWFILLIIAISSIGYCNKGANNSPITNIPVEDKAILTDLFQLLFSSGDFAYTFLDVKPMCQISYTMQYIRNFPENERFSRETHLARKGFEVWEKYQHLFPMKNLKFLLEESDQCEGHFAFILINPKKCLSIIEQHLSLVQKYYGQELPAEKLLERLCQGDYFQDGKNDATILGLLLGYPEKDVLVFNDQLEKLRSSKNKSSLRPCHLALRKNPLTPIRAPFFMTNKHEIELKEIKYEYAIKNHKLVEFYYSDDFLEKILNRFM